MNILKTVRDGAALLDRELGPGWEDRIDLDTLELSSTCNCVLGQLHKSYHPKTKTYSPTSRYMRFMRRLGVQPFQSCQFGFDSGAYTQRHKYIDYNRLNREWRRLIAGRRAAKLVA